MSDFDVVVSDQQNFSVEIQDDSDAAVVSITTADKFVTSVEDGLGESFDSVSKNLQSDSFVINYNSDGTVASMVYDSGITKTFTYGSGVLSSITLSGDTPFNISLTKSFTYTGGNLTGVSYS